MTPVPRIDAHVLYWDPDRPEHPDLAPELRSLPARFGDEQLRTELAAESIEGVVLVGAVPSAEEARALLATAEGELGVFGAVGWVDLTGPNVAERIAELQAEPGGHKLVGLRQPSRDGSDTGWLLDARVHRGLAAVGAAGLTFDLGITVRELPAAERLCRMLPGVRFVIEHLAAPPIASGDLSAWGGAILRLAELPNVYAKISGLVTEADWHTWSIDDLRHPIELAVDAFGADRLMLGSDWPRCLLAGGYSDAIDACRYLLAELPAHEQDDIRGGTAARVYRLAHHAR